MSQNTRLTAINTPRRPLVAVSRPDSIEPITPSSSRLTLRKVARTTTNRYSGNANRC